MDIAPSLITPIAARSVDAIKTYVGNIVDNFHDSAFVVEFEPLAPPDSLSVWSHERAEYINHKKQIWVHVDYRNYRKFYMDKWGQVDIPDAVIDHIMNRRFARELGYEYIRLLHISRGANVAAGAHPEAEAVRYQKSGQAPKNQESVISYADPSDLVKMLNIKTGAFPLKPVQDAMMMLYM